MIILPIRLANPKILFTNINELKDKRFNIFTEKLFRVVGFYIAFNASSASQTSEIIISIYLLRSQNTNPKKLAYIVRHFSSAFASRNEDHANFFFFFLLYLPFSLLYLPTLCCVSPFSLIFP